MSDASPTQDRAIWLAIMIIIATLVAGGTATLLRMAHATATDTFTATGAAFIATVTVSLAIWNFLHQRR